jgi:hypothetical protein
MITELVPIDAMEPKPEAVELERGRVYVFKFKQKLPMEVIERFSRTIEAQNLGIRVLIVDLDMDIYELER